VAINNGLPMRTLSIITFLILFIYPEIFCQINDTTDIIIDPIEEMPVFPGGVDSVWCFLERNFNFGILNSGDKKVKYMTGFIIDTLGKTSDFKIIAFLPREIILDHQDSLKISEIFRVLGLMQTWQPATQNNIKVRCLFSIPVMTPYTEFRCKQFYKKRKK
jgi:hypothetical protein